MEASGATTVVDSAGSNAGTVQNGAVSGAVGKLGNAISFDGMNDYVSTSLGPISNNLGNSFTLAAWVKNSNVSDGWGWIIGESAGGTFLFGKQGSEDAIHVNMDGIISGTKIANSGGVFDGNWHNVVLVRDSTDMKLYVDGGFRSATTVSNTVTTCTGNVSIGRRGNGEYWRGSVDEVAIYNRALSAAEIVSHYNSGVGTSLIVSGLKFQLAAKAADSGWLDSDFVGPDGTTAIYFTTSGTDIPSTGFDTKRYIKYKAYLSTADASYTPGAERCEYHL